MLTRVRKWGNSLGLRIPKALAEEASVREGSSVELEVKEGELRIRPVVRRYDLAELLDHVNTENLHAEIQTGPAEGREAW